MESVDYQISEWKRSTKMIFWSTILLFFAGIISTIYDYVSYAATLISMMAGIGSSSLGPLGRSTGINMSDLLAWGLSSKGLVIIGYVLYIWGLTSFSSIQRLEETSVQVRKIRTAGIVLAIVVLIDMVFGVLGAIPVLGWFFRLFVFIMTMCCYYKMKNAAGKLMIAEDFNDRAKRGSRNLRFAAVCEIRLMWLPLWTAIIMLLLTIMGIWMFGHSNSMQAAEDIIKFMGVMYGVVVFIVCIIAGCSIFCAFWWPIMGWYRVMTGSPENDKPVVQEENSNASITVEENKDEIDNEPQQEVQEKPIEESHSDSLLNIEEAEETPWLEQNKKWLFPLGGVAALALIIWGVVSFLGFGSKGNELLPVQKPAWDKFVLITHDEVLVFKEAFVGSAKLEIMQENLGSDVVEQYFKWDDTDNKRGYVSSHYKLYSNQILPLIGEEDEWYKVAVSEDGIGMTEGYVNKSYCRDVKQSPITSDVLKNMEFYNGHNASFALQTKGKYKNICFISIMSEMEDQWCDVAVLYDGVLINPLTKRSFNLFNPDGDVEQQFTSILPTPSSIQLVSYYFPEINKENLYTFFQDVSGSQSSNGIDGVEDKIFKGFSYVLDNGEFGLELFAEVNGERKTTNISGERVDILDQADYDGDGELEAVVYAWGGGNSIEPPFILYFDKETQEFKKALGFNDASESPEVKVEKWKGKPSFRVDVGLRKDRYVYEDHSVVLAESIAPNVGEVVSTITVTQLFGNSEEAEEKTAHIDIDGDGEKDKVLFMHDTSHFLGWGKQMMLKDMSGSYWCLPDGHEDIGVIGSKFAFIKPEEGDLPNLLTDDAWFYKWIDGKYVMQ